MAALNIDLFDLDGSQGFVVEGIDSLGNSGYAVSNAGDINGDGLDDLIIGAPGGYDVNFTNGKAYVTFGNLDIGNSGKLELSQLNGTNGFVIKETSFGEYTGFAVSGAGDINGDGLDDLIIGAPFAGLGGKSYLIFGRNSGFDASLSLDSLDGSNGFTINGVLFDDRLGIAVSSAGDVNGDGFEDVIIGADGAGDYDNYGNKSFPGKSYIVFGNSNVGNSGKLELEELDGKNGFAIKGIQNGDRTGLSVSSAKDVNGDGFDDLIIGAPAALDDSSGLTYLVFGDSNLGNSGNLELAELDGNNGFVFIDTNKFDRFGSSVSNAGDVNGDGFADMIIGAPGASGIYGYNNAGKSYLIFGNSNLGDSGAVLLSLLDGTNGFKIFGIDSFDGFGSSVSNAGDINGDGFADIVISASSADVNGKENAGESYIILGRGDNFPVETDSMGFDATLNLNSLHNTNIFVLSGIDSGDNFGSSVSNAGDINGDGIDDLIIGASSADVNDKENAGESYVIFGFSSLKLTGTRKEDVLTGGSGDDTISGRAGKDVLFGNDGNDFIFGGKDEDRIAGGAGNDSIRGQRNNDEISGDEGDDSISGGAGEDTLMGGQGNDFLAGNRGSDRILGEAGEDQLKGGRGNDLLVGGAGNDNISGNANQDILVGVALDNFDSSFGIGEQDTLNGGTDSDIFVLGNSSRVFYDDGDSFTAGDGDFALITDFDPSQDRIQLKDSADFYHLDFFIRANQSTNRTNAKIVYDQGISATGETIAVIEDIDPQLNITNPAFIFV